MNFIKLPFLALLFATGLIFSATESHAQVIVYEVKFKKLPGGVNHIVFDRGFVVADGSAQTGTFIFAGETSINGIKRSVFVRSDDSVEFFVAVRRVSNNRVIRKLVLRASASDGTSTAAYLATGDIDTKITGLSEQLEVSVAAATRLDGYCLSSDNESAESLESETESLGFAGAASMSLKIDRKETVEANRDGLLPVAVADELVLQLQAAGFDDLVELTADTTHTDTDTATETDQ